MPPIEGVKNSSDSVMKIKTAEQVIEFSHYAPNAKKVCIAGKFNSWNTESRPMKKGKDGTWKVKIILPLGTHEYKYFVDGAWWEDIPAAEMTSNLFGTGNFVISVE